MPRMAPARLKYARIANGENGAIGAPARAKGWRIGGGNTSNVFYSVKFAHYNRDIV
jgi:hypothetical protein